MRIFFLSYAYERGLVADAGGFRKLWEVAWALQSSGHEVLVFYPALPGFTPLRDVPSRAYPVVDHRGLRPLSAYLAMAGATLAAGRRFRPDVVYFRTGLNLLPPWLGWALRARVALEVNADTAEFLRREAASRWRQRLFLAAERLNVWRSDLIIAITPGLKQMVVERYRIPEAKVRVIPSGTDADHFTPGDSAKAKAELGLRPDQPVVGFVGIFYRHQGVHTLLQAAPRILAAAPATRLLLVGDGVMRQEWEALAERLQVSSCVRFTGQVSYRDLPRFLQAMDVVVAPLTSDRGETSPFKVLDALASGHPVIASDLPSIRNLAGEFEGAVGLVRPDDPTALADAVLALLLDPARRQGLGARGRAGILRRYRWDAVGRELEAAVNAIPAGGIRAGGSRPQPRMRTRVGRSGRTVASWAPLLGVVPRPERPQGLSAIVRVKDEEEWLAVSIRSIQDVADEILVGDNGSTDRTLDILRQLQREMPDRLRLFSEPHLDIRDLTNFLIDRTRWRWVIRWDADFVAQTAGPNAIGALRAWLAGLDPRRYAFVHLRMIELCGDLWHQRRESASRADCHCWTYSDSLRYVYDRVGYEAPKIPRWYRVLRYETPTFFHVDVKSSRRMFLSFLWKRYLADPGGRRLGSFEAYVEAELHERWGGKGIEAAAAAWALPVFQQLRPYDRERFGDYPTLLRPFLEPPRHRLLYEGGQIVGRTEPS